MTKAVLKYVENNEVTHEFIIELEKAVLLALVGQRYIDEEQYRLSVHKLSLS